MPMVRVKSYKVGDVLPVRSCHGGYALPSGLPEGSKVRIAEFRGAYRLVEWEGQRFTVYMANVDSGLEECPALSSKQRGSNME